jgi:cyanophycin synthetase
MSGPSSATLATGRQGPVRIAETAVLQGANVHARVPVIRLTLDVGPLEGRTTRSLAPGFADRLLARLPGLLDHDGLGQRLLDGDGLSLPEVVEHVAAELQRLGGAGIRLASPARPGSAGPCDAVYEYDDAEVALAAGRLAVELVDDVLGGLADHDGQLAQFVAYAEQRHLSAQGVAIVAAARARGIPVFKVRNRLVQLGHGRFQQRMWGSSTTRTSVISSKLARNKQYANRLFAALGLPVARQQLVTSAGQAVAAADAIGYPVVVKPNTAAHGDGASLHLTDAAQVSAAFDVAAPYGGVLVQRYVPGFDHRMLVIDGNLVAVAKRVPAHVVGDGVSSVRELVETVNRDPRRGRGHRAALTLLELDALAERLLARRGYTPGSVPPAGEAVRLREVGNLSSGGSAVDVTDVVHPDNRTMAVRAARAVGLDVIGVDFLTTDIARSWREVGGGICEINDRPGLRMHLWPSEGEPRDVVGAILDMLFPAGAPARMPVATITGSVGKAATARLLARILQNAGRRVGLATIDGVELDGVPIREGRLTPPTAARTVLLDPIADAAVIEAPARHIRDLGLGLDACDASAVLSVRPDSDVEPALRAVLEAATRLAVVNADDPGCLRLAQAGGLARVCLVTTRADHPAVDVHLDGGGCAVVQEQAAGPVTLHDGGRVVARFRTSMPWARFAVALAHGLGVSAQDIAVGLRD